MSSFVYQVHSNFSSRSLKYQDQSTSGSDCEVSSKHPNQKLKNELCKNFMASGFCKYRHKCEFAHGTHQLQQNCDSNDKYKTKQCVTFHQKGYCMYGERCNFLHSYKQNPQEETAKLRRMERNNRQIRYQVRRHQSFLVAMGIQMAESNQDEHHYQQVQEPFGVSSTSLLKSTNQPTQQISQDGQVAQQRLNRLTEAILQSTGDQKQMKKNTIENIKKENLVISINNQSQHDQKIFIHFSDQSANRQNQTTFEKWITQMQSQAQLNSQDYESPRVI